MPNPSELVAPRALSRRAVLGAALATGTSGVAGCTINAEPTPRQRRERRRREREPDVDPDVALAGLALRDERAALERFESAVRRHPRLGRELAPVIATHTEHVRLLADAAPDDAGADAPSPGIADDDSPTPRGARAALRHAAEVEQQLNTAMKRHAFAAQSGQFARLLAGMSAAAAQHTAVLTVRVADGARR